MEVWKYFKSSETFRKILQPISKRTLHKLLCDFNNVSTKLLAMSFFMTKIPKVGKFLAGTLKQQTRHLNLQEHISHSILNEHGIKTPRFADVKSVDEADKIARAFLTKNLMVKAQVLAGGRGLGKFKNGFKGGVHSATR